MMKLTPRVQKLGVEISKPSWMDLRNAVKSPALVGVLSAGRGEPRKPAKLAFVSRPPFIELPTAVQGNEGKTPIFSVPVTSCFCLAKSCVTRFSFALKAHPLAQSLPLVRPEFVFRTFVPMKLSLIIASCSALLVSAAPAPPALEKREDSDNLGIGLYSGALYPGYGYGMGGYGGYGMGGFGGYGMGGGFGGYGMGGYGGYGMGGWYQKEEDPAAEHNLQKREDSDNLGIGLYSGALYPGYGYGMGGYGGYGMGGFGGYGMGGYGGYGLGGYGGYGMGGYGGFFQKEQEEA
ncbi:MAG: hypothetical protein SGCHY_004524 [Lobulomycetales sp.]